jgi:hypothetical protein
VKQYSLILIERKYLQVASPNEGEFVTLENSLVSHVVRHYEECTMSFELFEQFRSFLDRTVEKEIKGLCSKKLITNEEFKIYMEIL